ncbi:uncharacterized protein METZ01_LOCUS503751 [marine metagenome]|uniref:Uncharacterized protein n=1 Tax=marine metagenome TaxID=408172 RepID=A0A383E217_9ZZZZ
MFPILRTKSTDKIYYVIIEYQTIKVSYQE